MINIEKNNTNYYEKMRRRITMFTQKKSDSMQRYTSIHTETSYN